MTRKHNKFDYSKLISHKRLREAKTSRDISEEFTSDKYRIIFSSYFRRLQQKAQVFSLEPNASVRSRLTHTLEVAAIGTSIAEGVSNILIDQTILPANLQLPFIKIVENACLLHDLGNPPFGHFAESAIKKWFDENWKKLFEKASGFKYKSDNSKLIREELIYDFIRFDGNPQAVRLITKLQDQKFDHDNFGFNLTYPQILSIVKYNAKPSEVDENKPLLKKPGFFYSEKEKIDTIKNELNFHSRFPLTYIMEAADDISYCLSDIEDGISKDILSSNTFFNKLYQEFDGKHNELLFRELVESEMKKPDNDGNFLEFKTSLIRHLIKHSIDSYIENHNQIIDGTLPELIKDSTQEGKILKALKTLSRKYLFRSKQAENKEIAGYKIISSILDSYKKLLELKHEDFYHLVKSKLEHSKFESRLDFEWRLLNMLPKKFILSYNYDYNKVDAPKDSSKFKQLEWFYRTHLIVDYISGMTDNYALETYKLLYGIKIR